VGRCLSCIFFRDLQSKGVKMGYLVLIWNCRVNWRNVITRLKRVSPSCISDHRFLLLVLEACMLRWRCWRQWGCCVRWWPVLNLLCLCRFIRTLLWGQRKFKLWGFIMTFAIIRNLEWSWNRMPLKKKWNKRIWAIWCMLPFNYSYFSLKIDFWWPWWCLVFLSLKFFF